MKPEDAPDRPTEITLTFEKGDPVAIDGKRMGAADMTRRTRAALADLAPLS